MEFKHIKLSDIGPGLIYKALCTSYKGWDDFSIWEAEWKQFDKDVHDFPDGIGSSGFGALLGKNIVGFISWDPRQYPSYVIIGHNCVLPKYRNQGIGKYQITCALNTFQKDGFQYAKVSTKRDQFFTHARKLKGIIVLDSLGDMDQHWDRIKHISEQSGLPILDHRVVGLDGLKAVVEEAIKKGDNDTAA